MGNWPYGGRGQANHEPPGIRLVFPDRDALDFNINKVMRRFSSPSSHKDRRSGPLLGHSRFLQGVTRQRSLQLRFKQVVLFSSHRSLLWRVLSGLMCRLFTGSASRCSRPSRTGGTLAAYLPGRIVAGEINNDRRAGHWPDRPTVCPAPRRWGANPKCFLVRMVSVIRVAATGKIALQVIPIAAQALSRAKSKTQDCPLRWLPHDWADPDCPTRHSRKS